VGLAPPLFLCECGWEKEPFFQLTGDEVTLCDFDDYELGIKCFDTLTFRQKISVLTTIGNGLFRKNVKAYCLYTTLAAHRLP